MFNRLTTYHPDPLPDDEERYGDFFVVVGAFGALAVTPETAHAIGRTLDRQRRPTWLVFRDRSGSQVRVRTRDVRAVCESTAAQRAHDRRLDRARQREERADRPAWDDE